MKLTCKYCGRADPQAVIEQVNGDQVRVICRQCYTLFNSCAACQYNACALEHYHGPLPLFVMQMVRHGNMAIQHQIPNPEVVKVTCMQGCKCYEGDDEGPIACHKRQDNICRNYSEVE